MCQCLNSPKRDRERATVSAWYKCSHYLKEHGFCSLKKEMIFCTLSQPGDNILQVHFAVTLVSLELWLLLLIPVWTMAHWIGSISQSRLYALRISYFFPALLRFLFHWRRNWIILMKWFIRQATGNSAGKATESDLNVDLSDDKSLDLSWCSILLLLVNRYYYWPGRALKSRKWYLNIKQ